MDSYKNVATVLQFLITDLKDLRKYRNTNKLFRNIVDDYCYDIWRKFMTQENFNKLASRNYVPFLDRWSNLKKEFKISPLQAFYYAVKKKCFDFSQKLLSYVDNPLALLISARYGFSEIVEVLLKGGVDVNTVFSSDEISGVNFVDVMNWWGEKYDRDDETIFYRKQKFVEMFLDRGSSVIHLACLSGDLKTVQKVLEFNPVITCYTEGSEASVTDFALKGGNKEIVRLVYLYNPGISLCLVKLHGEMKEYAERLFRDDRCGFTEISDFDEGDFKMFTKLSTITYPHSFFKKIFDFGNIAYYKMAEKVFNENLNHSQFQRETKKYIDSILSKGNIDKETQRYSYLKKFSDILNK